MRTPTWRAVVPTDSVRVVKGFRRMLNQVDLTQSRLAMELERSPKTINHWATGRSTPPLESMHLATKALRSLLERLSREVDAMAEVLHAVDSTLAAHRQFNENKSPEDQAEYLDAVRRLSTALDRQPGGGAGKE